MKLQLLPSTIENNVVSQKQHLSCFVIDDLVAIDAGSLAIATNDSQKKNIRDVILTHAHIDHIAGLPLYIDDLFAHIDKPVEVFALKEVIDILERDIFNWDVYPKFSELENENGVVLKYTEFEAGESFQVQHLNVTALSVNHNVPAVGFLVSDGKSKIAITGDTSEMDHFWEEVNSTESLDALLVECAFPEKLNDLAEISHHMTPKRLENELEKFMHKECPIYAINIKPMYYSEIESELQKLAFRNLNILKVGEEYNF